MGHSRRRERASVTAVSFRREAGKTNPKPWYRAFEQFGRIDTRSQTGFLYADLRPYQPLPADCVIVPHLLAAINSAVAGVTTNPNSSGVVSVTQYDALVPFVFKCVAPSRRSRAPSSRALTATRSDYLIVWCCDCRNEMFFVAIPLLLLPAEIKARHLDGITSCIASTASVPTAAHSAS